MVSVLLAFAITADTFIGKLNDKVNIKNRPWKYILRRFLPIRNSQMKWIPVIMLSVLASLVALASSHASSAKLSNSRYDACLWLILMTHHLVWITIQIPYIRSPIFGLYRLFGQENVNFHNFMVGFDGWMCHNGPTSSTTSKLHPLRRRRFCYLHYP